MSGYVGRADGRGAENAIKERRGRCTRLAQHEAWSVEVTVTPVRIEQDKEIFLEDGHLHTDHALAYMCDDS